MIEITLIDSVCFPESHLFDGSWEVHHLCGWNHRSQVLQMSALGMKFSVFYLETVSKQNTHKGKQCHAGSYLGVCAHKYKCMSPFES